MSWVKKMLPENEDTFKTIFGDQTNKNLVSIQLLGIEYKVPSDLNLLRAFQFISLTTEDFELKLQKHCWGGTCENCKCSFEDSQLDKAEGLACQMDVEKDLSILVLPRTMKKKLPHGSD